MNLAIPERVTEVEQLTRIRQELAEAGTLPEINKVIQQASAMQETALRAKVAVRGIGLAEEVIRQATDIANEAGAISLDAQAKAGGILREMAERGERAKNRNLQSSESPPATLDDLGVSKSDSSRWQQVWRVPDDVREEYVETATAAGGSVTRGGLLEYAREAGQKSATHQRAEEVVAGLLKDGPMEAKAFKAALKDAGVSDFGLDLAKESLGVVAERSGAGVVWKFADPEVDIPRMGPGGKGWECPNCGGYGWVHDKPKFRNPRGYERERILERDRAARARRDNGMS